MPSCCPYMVLLANIPSLELPDPAAILLTTNSTFLFPQELFNHGILYRKIKCVGKEIPNDDVVSRLEFAYQLLGWQKTDELLAGHRFCDFSQPCCMYSHNFTQYISGTIDRNMKPQRWLLHFFILIYHRSFLRFKAEACTFLAKNNTSGKKDAVTMSVFF